MKSVNKCIINNLLLIMAIALASCSAGLKEEKSGSDSATFIVSKVNASSARHIFDDEWSLPFKTTFIGKTCLSDNAYGKSIVGQKFEIVGDNISETVVSDQNGCIEWNDYVRFNFLAPQDFIVVERTITGLGDFAGEYVVKFEIDPWKKEVKNLLHSSTSAAHRNIDKTLFISSPKFTLKKIQDLKNRAIINGEIALTPKFERYYVNGLSAETGVFEKGEFSVTVMLFEESVSGKRTVLSLPTSFDATIDENHNLIGNISIDLFQLPSDSETMELKMGLRVVPNKLTAPKFLDDVEIVTTMAKYKYAVIGNPEVASLPEFSYSKVLAQASRDDESKFGFRIKEPSVSFFSYVDEFNGTVATKGMKTKVVTCLINAVTKEKVKELPFIVSVLDENKNLISETDEMVVDENGCITSFFNEEYNLDVKRTSNWIKRYLQVKGLDGAYSQSIATRQFYINPWEINRYAYTSNAKLPISYTEVQDSKLYTSRFSITYHGNDESKYRVNRHLDLSFVKSFKIEFSPKINRGFKLASESTYDRLYSGKLNMKLMVLGPKYSKTAEALDELLSPVNKRIGTIGDNVLKNYVFVTGVNQEVKIVDGNVSEFIDLKFDTNNLRFMATRVYVVVELSSTDSESSIQPVVLTIPAMLGSTASNSDSISPDSSTSYQTKEIFANRAISQYFAMIDSVDVDAVPASNWKIGSYELFDKMLNVNNNLKTVDGLNKLSVKVGLNKPEVKQLITEKDFSMILEKSKGETDNSVQFNNYAKSTLSAIAEMFKSKPDFFYTTKKLCWYFYDGSNAREGFLDGDRITDREDCVINPEKFLSFNHVKHIVDITKQPKTSKGSLQRSMSVGANHTSVLSRNKSTSWGWRTSLKGGMDLFKANGFSAGIGGDVSYGQSWSNSESDSEAVNIGEFQWFEEEEIVLEFEAKFKSCVLINAKGAVQKGAPNTLRICEREDKVETLEEHWYVLNEGWRRRSFYADPGAENLMRIYQLFRGEKQFKKFKDEFEANNRQLFFYPTNSRTDITKYVAGLFESSYGEKPSIVNGAFPGLMD